MTTMTTPQSDLEIARSVTPRPIVDVARELGLRDDEIEPYGSTKAKITLAAIQRLEAERARGKYVLARPRSASGNRALDRSSGSRAGPPAAVGARSSRWRTSTST
jgi:hypothetical protein